MTDSHRWLRTGILIGVAYLVIGVTFGALAGSAATHQVMVAWRLAAWLASAVVFAAQIGYEHHRLRSSPPRTAWHAAAAAGAGAFLLAVAATVHAHWATSGPHRALGPYFLALVVWPAVTAVPAFLVALAAAAALARTRRGA